MNERRPRGFRRWPPRAAAGAAAWAAFTVVACAGPEKGIPARAPSGRPADGLLADTALQAVVDLQELRDGAALAARLTDPRPAVRARAAFALGSVQDPEALGPLLHALRDSVAAVRRDAAFALGQLHPEEALTPLAAAVEDEKDSGARARMLEALGKIPLPEASETLAGLSVSDAAQAERMMAVAALGGARGVSTADARQLLLSHLDDLDPRVREAAAYFFGRLDTPQVWAPQVAEVRGALDGYAKDDPAAMYLVQGLGRLANPFDAQRLADWASTAKDWRTRVNAMAALGELPPDAGTREVLQEGLDDSSPHVAVTAARAMARHPPEGGEAERAEGWIDAHPDAWRVVQVLLPWLAEAGEHDFVMRWVNASPAADTARVRVGMRALADLSGAQARERLAEGSRSAIGGVAAVAVNGLARRWRTEGADSTLRAFYVDIFREALARPERAVRFAAAGGLQEVTGDSVDVGPSEEPETEQARRIDWAELAGMGTAPHLVLETPYGRVDVRLDPEEAPLTVQTLARLAREGRLDGVPFHRVVANFVIQGGDFSSGDGFGFSGFAIRSEFTEIPFRRGVIGMASSGKDTESSQFFVTHSMQPHLDGAYTAFGWVVSGMSAVDQIQVGDRVVRATIEPGS